MTTAYSGIILNKLERYQNLNKRQVNILMNLVILKDGDFYRVAFYDVLNTLIVNNVNKISDENIVKMLPEHQRVLYSNTIKKLIINRWDVILNYCYEIRRWWKFLSVLYQLGFNKAIDKSAELCDRVRDKGDFKREVYQTIRNLYPRSRAIENELLVLINNQDWESIKELYKTRRQSTIN